MALVARDLGTSEKSLYEWTGAAKDASSGGLNFEERDERARLRRKKRRLRQERDTSIRDYLIDDLSKIDHGRPSATSASCFRFAGTSCTVKPD